MRAPVLLLLAAAFPAAAQEPLSQTQLDLITARGLALAAYDRAR